MQSIVVVTFVLFVSKFHGSVAAPVATTYDQQQTGDLNVQVHLEDIQIVALLDSGVLGDYGEYDYAYDYSDFTLKPITSHTTTTTTPTTAASPESVTTSSKSSVEPWYTWPTISPGSSTSQSTTLQSDLAVAVSSSTPKSEEQKVDINYLKKKYDSTESSTAGGIPSSASITDRSPVTTGKDVDVSLAASADLEVTTKLTQEESDWDKLFAGVEDVLAAEKLHSSLSSSASSSETQELSEALLEQPQQQTLKKCVPGQGQDQNRRCVRRHLRRRVPSPLLPFGIRLTPRINRRRDELPSDP